MKERKEVEPKVDLDFETLYNRSLAEQLGEYLEILFETVGKNLPIGFIKSSILSRSNYSVCRP